MKKTDALVNLLAGDIARKDVLEVACGAADFSISAARVANHIACIDLDDSRLNSQARQNGIHFQIMDATQMAFSDNAFDTIVIYNAFFHIQPQWNMIEKECRRVIKPAGKIFMVGTWSLDTNLMIDAFGNHAAWHEGFLIAEMTKQTQRFRL